MSKHDKRTEQAFEQDVQPVVDPVLRYDEVEMRYLRESGRESARARPDRARMLNAHTAPNWVRRVPERPAKESRLT